MFISIYGFDILECDRGKPEQNDRRELPTCKLQMEVEALLKKSIGKRAKEKANLA